ncbi:MAG: PD-(D/E)XK nuclease family protein [Gallionella sp.]
MTSKFLDRVAKHILSRHARDLPDLRGATVLLPSHHVAQPLAQAMVRAAGKPALLLPQMVTLGDWARSVPLDTIIQPDTQRITALYQALRERRWFADADLWGLSRELLALMDELTRHHVALPLSAEEFSGQLAMAYQARSGQAMQFEARVVHELWYAMAAGGEQAGEQAGEIAGGIDSVRAYQQQLALLAQQVDSPLHVLLTGDLGVPDAHFVEACRARVPVTVFDVREMAADAPHCALLARALRCDTDGADLRSDAAQLQQLPVAALTGRLQLFAAHGLEQEAQAADVQIRQWLLDGRRSIAVVVQDRLVARRVRAMLERAQVQVQDETGWTFATLSVSTVVMRWLEALQNDFYYQDVLDLFKSPFLFADGTAGERKQAAYLFEQMVRKHGVIAHLQGFVETAEREAPELVQPLVRLRQAALALPRKNATLAEWLDALQRSLDILGVAKGWSRDAAGQQLLQLLAQWADELRGDGMPSPQHNPIPEGEEAIVPSPARGRGSGRGYYSFAEWRRWLAQQLDLNTFSDTAVESAVQFTHLAATRWRSFDAVLLLGCDAAHLPAPVDAGRWFNDAVRASLGLPLSIAQQHQVRDDLLALLALNDNVLVTWQASLNGEANLLSPHFEMLRALHLLAYRDDLAADQLRDMLPGAQVRSEAYAAPQASAMPHPVAFPALLPGRVSPSGYNSLVACPYQFYARHVLRLNDLDEVREELDKRDYGSWVHAALQRFHGEFPLLQNYDRGQLEDALQRISTEVFADALARDYLAQAWLLRWQQQIPAYLDWQLENEQAGWRYLAAEQPFEVELNDDLTLHGRIDRVDERNDEPDALCVLDYKTQTITKLKNKLKDAGEDVQLACYAYARAASAAAFVSLEGDKVAAVAPPQDMSELASLNIARLQTVFEQMRAGAALPANGTDAVCAYCEMQGLCRKSDWNSGIRNQESGISSPLPQAGEGAGERADG